LFLLPAAAAAQGPPPAGEQAPAHDFGLQTQSGFRLEIKGYARTELSIIELPHRVRRSL